MLLHLQTYKTPSADACSCLSLFSSSTQSLYHVTYNLSPSKMLMELKYIAFLNIVLCNVPSYRISFVMTCNKTLWNALKYKSCFKSNCDNAVGYWGLYLCEFSVKTYMFGKRWCVSIFCATHLLKYHIRYRTVKKKMHLLKNIFINLVLITAKISTSITL